MVGAVWIEKQGVAVSFADSWAMLKASVNVLWTRKELALFPVISGVANVVVAVGSLLPIVVVAGEDRRGHRAMSSWRCQLACISRWRM